MTRSKKRTATSRAGKAGRVDRSPDRPEIGDRENGESGRVVAHHGVAVLIRFDHGLERQVWLKPDQKVVAGDRVVVVGERLIVEPAHGILRRRDARGRERTIAANLDVLGIVVAAEPREPPGYIDRGFVIARAAGIEAVLIVNKVDLESGRDLADRLGEIYGTCADVYAASATTAEGVDAISELLAGGRLGALVGPSGVGKSSLLNTLVPDLDLRVAALNRRSKRGRHTTTTATLHTLSSGGFLVDTAGFKDFIAVDVDVLETASFFPGFESARERGCRFRNCLHRTEPDCGVLGAVETGEISSQRHRNYVELLEELTGSPRPSR